MYKKNKTTSLLKNMSKFFIIEFVLMIVFTIIGIIKSILNIHDLGTAVLFVFSLLASLFLIPDFISGICGLRYYLGKNNGKLTACWIWGIISLLVNVLLIYIMIKEVEFANIIIPIFLFLIFIFPNILYLISCYKEKLKNKI